MQLHKITSVLLLLFMLFSMQVKAYEENYSATLDKIQIVNQAFIESDDPNRFDPPSDANGILYTLQHDVHVSLVYNRSQQTDIIGSEWVYNVDYEIIDPTISPAPAPIIGEVQIENRSKNGVYLDGDLFENFTGAVKLTVTGVKATNLVNNQTVTDPALMGFVPEDIHLELKLVAKRIDYLDSSAETTLSAVYDANTHKAELNLTAVTGAEAYEIEWFYFDLQSQVSTSDIPALFKEYGSRIKVTELQYTMDLVYPEGGVVLFRARPVGRFIRNVNDDFSIIKNGSWMDYVPSSHIAILFGNQPGFENDKIWQHTLSFAEEGKRKNVISYLDHSLKPRQSVTNLSTDESVLIAENFYDTEGRSTISILPVPVSDPMQKDLFFKPDFNKFDASTAYKRSNFDKPTNADPLDNNFGASKYYSPNNASNSMHRDFIPDAENYPITQVRYERDGTGRINAMSGIGSDYQLGSGRETRYFYGSVSDTELRRLFGRNVGESKYYKKNAVMEANGQLSIIYQDHTGRSIATALAGHSPENVQALDSQEPREITVNLMSENELDIPGGTSNLFFKLFKDNPVQQTYNFHYDLTGIINDTNAPTCIDCKYKLEITIEDTEGELLDLTDLNGPGSSDPKRIEHVFQNSGADCSSTSYVGESIDFTAEFTEIGNYFIRKKLTVIPDDIDALIADAVSNGNLEEETVFIEEYITENFDPTECINDCEAECRYTILATMSESDPNFQSALEDCISESCDPIDNIVTDAAVTTCEGILFQMIADLSPDGCLYDNSSFWSDFSSEIEDIQFVVNNAAQLGLLEIESTSNPAFLALLQDPLTFQEGWADSLVILHPEYCRYTFCKETAPFDYFNYELAESVNWATSGYAAWDWEAILNADPLLNLDLDWEDEMLAILDDFDNYCGNHPPEQGGQVLCSSGTIEDYISAYFPTASPEEEWRIFYGIYQHAKQLAFYAYRAEHHCDSGIDDLMENYGCAPIAEMPEILTMTPTSAEAAANDGVLEYCETYCDANLELWMDQLEAQCPNLVTNSSLNLDVRNHLQAFCGCDDGTFDPLLNPLLAILDENIIVDQDLIAVNDLLSNNGCATALEEIANPQNEVYEPMIIDGEPYYIPATLNQACIATQCLFGLFNDQILLSPSGTFPAGFTTDVTSCLNLGVSNIQVSGNKILVSSGMGCFILDFLGITTNDPNANPNPLLTDIENFEYVGCTSTYLASAKFYINGVEYSTRINLDGSSDCGGYEFDQIPAVIPIIDQVELDPDQAVLDCEEQLIVDLTNEAETLYEELVNDYLSELLNNKPCFTDPFLEAFTATYETIEHHYTLYYYDQAGNLIQTVPPRGVNPLAETAFTDGIWDGTAVNHTLETRYRHNTLEQARWQNSPDGGETNFYYDYAQRLRLSQNAQQNLEEKQSYTKFDSQGRISEVGEMEGLPNIILASPTALATFLNDPDFPELGDFDLDYRTITEYDEAKNNNISQENLRGRVSRTVNENVASYYDYDIHGNVRKLNHQIAHFGASEIEYEYDLISGNVNRVWFQKGTADQFAHQYEYDADNRLLLVETSTDGVAWTKDAMYHYYAHGPLARVELGHDQVQGLDYFYTLQGWIKGVNMPTKRGLLDPGQDGKNDVSNPNRLFAKDEMAYSLGYNLEDYVPIGGNDMHLAGNTAVQAFSSNILTKNGAVPGLFNGNISYMISYIPGLESPAIPNNAMVYQYDALHRIKQGISYSEVNANWGEDDPTNTGKHVYYDYDPNGNITHLTRHGMGQMLDDLSYNYERILGGVVDTEHNQLQQVTDAPNASQGNFGDLVNQSATDNYKYDKIGNLVYDASESSSIEWTVYGKVQKVQYDISSTRGDITFMYDAAGNRLMKIVENTDGDAIEGDVYIRDASGNTLGVYALDFDLVNSTFKRRLKEVNLFGSSRLGNYSNVGVWEDYTPPSFEYPFTMSEPLALVEDATFSSDRGSKAYELSNHLGNVLTVVSDKVEGELNNKGVFRRYRAKVKSATDYYPFGWAMPGRKYNSDDYRYGFNGKENDQEWGSQVIQDYGFRIYNPSIGKFLSVDPLTQSYPELTPYQFSSNTPIQAVDLDGLEMLDSEESMIRIINGVIAMNLDNARNVTRNRYYLSNSHNKIVASKYPKRDIVIGNMGGDIFVPKINIARGGLAGPISSREYEIMPASGGKPLTGEYATGQNGKLEYRYSGNPNSRQRRRVRANGNFKTAPIKPFTGGSRSPGRLVGPALIVWGLAEGLLLHSNMTEANDWATANEHYEAYGLPAYDMVLDNIDLLPERFQTEDFASEIANYILQGEFEKDHSAEEYGELKTIAEGIMEANGVPIKNKGFSEDNDADGGYKIKVTDH